MGAGLAKQAAQRFPTLPLKYGEQCLSFGALTPVLTLPPRIVMFPVKPLNVKEPDQSWRQDASLALIEKSTDELADMESQLKDGSIVLPMVGCGRGNLDRSQVYPILWRILKSDRFLLCKDEPGPTRIRPTVLAVPEPLPPLEEVGSMDEYVNADYVQRVSTLSKGTITNYEALGLFPRRRRLGPGRVAWVKLEVDSWLASRKRDN